jgi:transcriptional regulator with XRE-family HTH domain
MLLEVTFMRTPLAQAIRTARRSAGLTQEQLGRRLGLQGRAIHRWECDETAPRRGHRRKLLEVLGGVDPGLLGQLTSALAPAQGNASSVAPAAPAPAASVSPTTALELCLFRMADELDLPPRKVRTPLSRLLKRVRAANLTLEALQQHLDAAIANAP